MEARTTVGYVHVRGPSQRAIARELDISRNTVARALASYSPAKYSRKKQQVNPDIMPFVEQIKEMFFEKKFRSSRILRELRKMGFEGSKSALYRYLKKLKESQPSSRVSMRYETGPGEQAQFDWSPYTVQLGTVLSHNKRGRLPQSLDVGYTGIGMHSAAEPQTKVESI